MIFYSLRCNIYKKESHDICNTCRELYPKEASHGYYGYNTKIHNFNTLILIWINHILKRF